MTDTEVPREISIAYPVIQVTEAYLEHHIEQARYKAWHAIRNGYINLAIEEHRLDQCTDPFAERLKHHLNRLKYAKKTLTVLTNIDGNR